MPKGQTHKEEEPFNEKWKEQLVLLAAAGEDLDVVWDKIKDIIPDKYKDTYLNTDIYGNNGPKILIRNILKQKVVKPRFEYLRQIFIENAEKEGCLTFTQKRQMLSEIAMDFGRPTVERLKAIEADNKMVGDLAPEKQEVNQTVDIAADLLERIRQRKSDRPK